jgi:Uma2 family endonuclease
MGIRKYEEHYVYNDYKIWEGRWELIDGFPYAMSPSPIIKHQEVEINIILELSKKNNCERCKILHEMDWKVKDDTIVRPDVVLVCGTFIGDKYIIQTPSIIFEILSPSTAKKDRKPKYSLYEENSVKYYVIVDIDNFLAEIYTLENGNYKQVGNITKDNFIFNLDDCKVDFDFSKIW